MTDKNKIELNDQEVVTEPCRLAFPALFEKKERFRGSDKQTYQAVVLIPPDVDLKPFVRAIKAALVDKFGKVVDIKPEKLPLRKCEEKGNVAGYEPGWRYINTHSGFPPGVVDQRRQPIIDATKVYGGCWCRFMLRAYAWDHASGGRGVSFSLEAVQFVRHDEPFSSGGRDASLVFDPIEVSDDEYLEDVAPDREDNDDLAALFD